MKKIILHLFILAALFSCRTENFKKEKVLIFGHAYGNSLHGGKGVYKPLKDLISIEAKGEKRFVFLGDFIRENSVSQINAFKQDINNISDKTICLRGNHEFINEKKKGIEPLKSYNDTFFVINRTLICGLETYNNGWRIGDDQLSRIKELSKDVFSIIVLTPQVVWWELIEEQESSKWFPDEDVHREFNSEENKDSISNFKSEVIPFFNSLNKKVCFISGDAGGLPYVKDYYVIHDEFIFLNTGMGWNRNDNYVEIKWDDRYNYYLFLKNLQSGKVIRLLE